MSVYDSARPLDDLEGWREEAIARRQARDIVDGEVLARDLKEGSSGLSVLLIQLREDASEAVQALIDADLFSDTGIEDARRVQARILRFTDLISLIDPLIEAARNAEDAGVIERSVEQLMEQMNGRQTRYRD